MTVLYLMMVFAGLMMVFAASQFIGASNRIAALDARCQTAFADIDVQMKRRADLIPGLVECVRGFAAHEDKLLSEVIEARRGSIQSSSEARQQAETVLGRKVSAVISLAEKYPELAASSHFRELRGELIDAEDRIAAARRFFNLAVEEYNATLGQFPANTIATRRNLTPRRPYDLGIERVLLDEPVTVKF